MIVSSVGAPTDFTERHRLQRMSENGAKTNVAAASVIKNLAYLEWSKVCGWMCVCICMLMDGRWDGWVGNSL